MLIALLWKRNGWTDVELIPADPAAALLTRRFASPIST
jgi:hypothetical protein